jgi:hypothetical protein
VPKTPPKSTLLPTIMRSAESAPRSVEQAIKSDRAYFDEHPDEDSYIREFVPGEFGKAELPEIPDGFRYATHVERVNGEPIGRYRRLMAVCDGVTSQQMML